MLPSIVALVIEVKQVPFLGKDGGIVHIIVSLSLANHCILLGYRSCWKNPVKVCNVLCERATTCP